jgi:hypothetical protein
VRWCRARAAVGDDVADRQGYASDVRRCTSTSQTSKRSCSPGTNVTSPATSNISPNSETKLARLPSVLKPSSKPTPHLHHRQQPRHRELAALLHRGDHVARAQQHLTTRSETCWPRPRRPATSGSDVASDELATTASCPRSGWQSAL